MRNLTRLAALAVFALGMAACDSAGNGDAGPGDDAPPRVTLLGDATVDHPLNTEWKDPGATAFDDIDGTLEVVTLGSVNTAIPGRYILTYVATDSSANVASVQRTVIVQPGTYELKLSNFGDATVMVSSGGQSFSCSGRECAFDLEAGAMAELTPVDNSDWEFYGWLECDEVVGRLCRVNMDRHRMVLSTFTSTRPVEYNPMLKELNDEQTRAVVEYGAGVPEIRFAPVAGLDDVVVGTVLVATGIYIAEDHPDNVDISFLRRVTAVERDALGGLTVTTEEGTLLDVVTQGTLVFRTEDSEEAKALRAGRSPYRKGRMGKNHQAGHGSAESSGSGNAGSGTGDDNENLPKCEVKLGTNRLIEFDDSNLDVDLNPKFDAKVGFCKEAVLYDRDKNKKTRSDQLRAVGGVAAGAAVELVVDITYFPPDLNYARIWARGATKGEIRLEVGNGVSGEKEENLGKRVRLGKVVAGVVPVFFYLQPKIYGKANASATAVANITNTLEVEGAIVYDEDSGWRAISAKRNSFDFTLGDIKGDVALEGGLIGQVQVRVADSGGPDFDIRPYIGATAVASVRGDDNGCNFKFGAYYGLALETGGSADVLGASLGYTTTLFNDKKPLYTKCWPSGDEIDEEIPRVLDDPVQIDLVQNDGGLLEAELSWDFPNIFNPFRSQAYDEGGLQERRYFIRKLGRYALTLHPGGTEGVQQRHYRVRAVDYNQRNCFAVSMRYRAPHTGGAEEELEIGEACAVIPLTDDIAPGKPDITYANGQGQVGWTPVADNFGVARYRVVGVEQGADSLDDYFITGTTNGNIYGLKLPDPPEGVSELCYTVTALDWGGNATRSDQRCSESVPPSVPKGVVMQRQLTRNDGTVLRLNWEPSTDNMAVVRYHIQPYYKESDGQINRIPGLFLGNYWHDPQFNYTDIVVEKTYCVAIQAIDSSGNFSGYDRLYCDGGSDVVNTPPHVPRNLRIEQHPENGWRGLGVLFSPPHDAAGVLGYNVYHRPESGPESVARQPTARDETPVQYRFLEVGSVHCFRVTAVNSFGEESVPTPEQCVEYIGLDNIPPSVPEDYFLIDKDARALHLNWTASTDNRGVARYLVQLSSGKGAYELLATTPVQTRSFSIEGLPEETSLCYRIAAEDATGNRSGFSTGSCVLFRSEPPPSPTGLVFELTGRNSIALSWDAVSDDAELARYKTYAVHQGSGLATTAIVGPRVTDFEYSELKAGDLYCFKVTASNNFGRESPPSIERCVATDIIPPSVPEILQVQQSAPDAVSLSWRAATDNHGIDAYEIDTTAGDYFGDVDGTDQATTISGLNAHVEYCFTVTARDFGGNLSAATDPACITLDVSPPTTPVLEALEQLSNSNLRLRWNAATDNRAVTGYRVRSGDGAVLSSVNGSTLQWDYTEAQEGQRYCFTVEALDAAGNVSAPSSAVCAIIDTQPPTPATGLTLTQENGSTLRLEWTPATDAVGVTRYEVARAQGGAVGSTDGTDNQLLIRQLAPDVEHCFVVIAFDAAGNVSQPSSAACGVIDVTPPTQPVTLTPVQTDTSTLQVRWEASSDNQGVAGYRIQSSSGGPSAQIPGSELSFLAGSLSADVEYCFTVEAYDAVGNTSPASAPACATIDASPPTRPELKSLVQASTSSLDLSWAASSDNRGVTRYEVRSAGDDLVEALDADQLAHTISPLEPDIEHCFTVTAFDAVGNASEVSAPLCAIIDATPPTQPPALQLTSVDFTSLHMSWGASTDNRELAGYRILAADGSVFDEVGADAQELLLEPLDDGQEYCFTVMAFDAVGNESTTQEPVCAYTYTDPPETWELTLSCADWAPIGIGQDPEPLAIPQGPLVIEQLTPLDPNIDSDLSISGEAEDYDGRAFAYIVSGYYEAQQDRLHATIDWALVGEGDGPIGLPDNDLIRLDGDANVHIGPRLFEGDSTKRQDSVTLTFYTDDSDDLPLNREGEFEGCDAVARVVRQGP